MGRQPTPHNAWSSALRTLQMEETLSHLRTDDVAEEFFRQWSLDSLIATLRISRFGVSGEVNFVVCCSRYPLCQDLPKQVPSFWATRMYTGRSESRAGRGHENQDARPLFFRAHLNEEF